MIAAVLLTLSFAVGMFALGAARQSAVEHDSRGFGFGAIVFLVLCMIGCWFAGAAQ